MYIYVCVYHGLSVTLNRFVQPPLDKALRADACGNRGARGARAAHARASCRVEHSATPSEQPSVKPPRSLLLEDYTYTSIRDLHVYLYKGFRNVEKMFFCNFEDMKFENTKNTGELNISKNTEMLEMLKTCFCFL